MDPQLVTCFLDQTNPLISSPSPRATESDTRNLDQVNFLNQDIASLTPEKRKTLQYMNMA